MSTTTISNSHIFTAARTIQDGPPIPARVKGRKGTKTDKTSKPNKRKTDDKAALVKQVDEKDPKDHFSWLGTPITAKAKKLEDEVLREEDQAEDECCLCGEMYPWQEMVVVTNQGRTCPDCVQVDEPVEKSKETKKIQTKTKTRASSVKNGNVSSAKTISPNPVSTARRLVIKPILNSVKKASSIKAASPKNKAKAKTAKVSAKKSKATNVETKTKGTNGTKSEYQVKLEATQQSRRERAKLREALKHATCYACGDEGYHTRVYQGEILCTPCSDQAHDDLVNKRWRTCGQCGCHSVARMAYGKDSLCTDCNTKDYEKRYGTQNALQAAFNKLEYARENKTRKAKKPKQARASTKSKVGEADGVEKTQSKAKNGKEEKETKDADMEFEPMDFPPGINANHILPPHAQQLVRTENRKTSKLNDVIGCSFCERKLDLRTDTVTLRRVNGSEYRFCTDDCSELFVKNTSTVDHDGDKKDDREKQDEQDIQCDYCYEFMTAEAKIYKDELLVGNVFCCDECIAAFRQNGDASRNKNKTKGENKNKNKDTEVKTTRSNHENTSICDYCLEIIPTKIQILKDDEIFGHDFCCVECVECFREDNGMPTRKNEQDGRQSANNWSSKIARLPAKARLICNHCGREFPKDKAVTITSIYGAYFCSSGCANRCHEKPKSETQNTYTKAPKHKADKSKPY